MVGRRRPGLSGQILLSVYFASDSQNFGFVTSERARLIGGLRWAVCGAVVRALQYGDLGRGRAVCREIAGSQTKNYDGG